MSWIKQHSDILTHQKLYRLAAGIGKSRFEALGYLSGLWHYTAANCWADGNLTPFIDAIESMLEWRGEKGELLAGFRDCGLLDGNIVHEWTEHQAEFIKSKGRYAINTNPSRTELKPTKVDFSPVQSELKSAKVRTDKIRLDKIRKETTSTTLCPKPAASVGGFDAFWQSYPRKVGKDKALDAWKKKKPPLEAVLAALAWQINSDAWRKEGGAYIPHPTTYLNQGRWKDEQPICMRQAVKVPPKPMTAREKAILSGEWEKLTPEQREALIESEV